jgi:hypothetical protein
VLDPGSDLAAGARHTEGVTMRIGASLLLIALGAVLRFAITKPVNGINLDAVGVILMIVGAAGLVITLVLMSTRRRTDVIHHRDGTTLMTPADPVDPTDPRY